MTAQDVRALPLNEKILIMEALWEDLRARFDRIDVSPAQQELLDRRRARVEEGTDTLLDWDAVKSTIGRP